MPAKPETKLQQKIRAALVEHGGLDIYIVKNHGGPHTIPGVPDFTGCYRGVYFGMEVKLPTRRKRVTDKQAHNLHKIRRAGGISNVVCSPEEALAILHKIDKRLGTNGAEREAA